MSGTAADGPVLELLSARRSEIAPGLVVRRLLPRRQHRAVGPWCFVDHFGPVTPAPGRPGMDIAPHPHIGLQTVTWLLEGRILHRDSLGTAQLIEPGQLNWMTAGRGIVHSEEAPPGGTGTVHGVQLWVALPDSHRAVAPAFEHHAELPRMAEGDTALTVLAGRLGGLVSPAKGYSPLVAVDIALPSGGRVRLPLDPTFEHALLVLQGSADAAGHGVGVGELLYLGTRRQHLDLSADEASRVLLLGGLPLDEELFMWWNFVARSRAEVAEARHRWQRGDFGTVPGARRDPLSAPPL